VEQWAAGFPNPQRTLPLSLSRSSWLLLPVDLLWMLISKSSLVDLFFFYRQLVSTQLHGGLGVLVPSSWHNPQTGISFPLRCPAVVSVQYMLVLLRLIPCLFMWLQWSFSSFVDEIHLACSVSSSCFTMFHWHISLSTQLQLCITAVCRFL